MLWDIDIYVEILLGTPDIFKCHQLNLNLKQSDQLWLGFRSRPLEVMFEASSHSVALSSTLKIFKYIY